MAKRKRKTRDGYEMINVVVLDRIDDISSSLERWQKKGWEHLRTVKRRAVGGDVSLIFRRKLKEK